MMNLFDKVKAVCALVVMGLGLAAYSAAPTVTSVTAQQRYPWNGLVDIAVTFNGAESDVAKANCTFAATNSATKTALPVLHITRNGNDSGSGNVWTRSFVWDTLADVGGMRIDDVELIARGRIYGDGLSNKEPCVSGVMTIEQGDNYGADEIVVSNVGGNF